MSKYHINKHGVPAPCKAIKGNCPLGGDDNHYKTFEEAQQAVDKQNIANHNLLPEVENSNKLDMKFEQMADELYEGFNYNDDIEVPESSNTDPLTLTNEYFKARIKLLQGEKVNMNLYEHDWVDEVESNTDFYRDSGDFYHDLQRGGHQYDKWTQNSEYWLQEDVNRAEKVNEAYDEYKEYVDDIFKQVKAVDWTQYNK